MVGMTSPSGRAALGLAVLILAVLAGVGLRAGGNAPKTSFTHDESISYLAATCHQGEWYAVTFDPRPPFGAWAPAAAWQRFLRPERAGCLGRIRDDLARFDIHPPLYFWLLHGASLVLGVGMWTGAALNLVLFVLGALGLFGLALRILGDRLRAAAVVLVWALSPGVVQVFAEARQYELLGLLTILFTWQALRFAERPGRASVLDAAGVAVLAALGMLTHYHFALVVLGVGGVLAVRLRWGGGRRLLAGAGALTGGAVLFLLAHPGFWRAFATQRAQAGGFVPDQFPGRVAQSARALSELVLPPGLAASPLRWVGAGLIVAATVWLLARRAEFRGEAAAVIAGRDRRAGPRAAVALFAWTAGATAALFLGFVSHGLAMTPKYLAAVWPFAAFVPVLAVVGLAPRARRAVAVAGGAMLLAFGALSAYDLHAADPPVDPTGAVRAADAAVVDNVARGIFPRVVWPMRGDTRVYAATQRALLARPAPWLSGIRGRAILVSELPVSDPRYGNSPGLGRRIVASARAQGRLRPEPGGVAGLGRVFVVERPGDRRRAVGSP